MQSAGTGNQDMQNSSVSHNQIAAALIGVVKQIKAIKYYPLGHPALETAAAESLRGFEPVLADHRQLALTVRKEGFLLDDGPVAKNNQVLVQLANFCFARRIQHLTFLTDLKSTDLQHFVHFLLLDPQIIQRQGGFQVILEKARITTIWTNIRDLDEILQRKHTIENLPEDPSFDPAKILNEVKEDTHGHQVEALDLAALVAKLEKEEDDTRFHRLLQELIPLLRLQLIEDRRALVLRALLLLCRCATGKQYSLERRRNARLAIDQLATDEMANYLVAYLFAAASEQKIRDILGKILAFMGDRIGRRLMEMLADERMSGKRKVLGNILVRSGATALPIVYEYLADERWYVVRNAAAILGDIRNQEALSHLTPLLQHDEIRVRRETIRALTKISGQRAINILLQVAVNHDHDTQRQAILSLGAVRATIAVPTLLTLLKKPDWSQRAIDLKKDAIRALGEIRDPAATAELVRIVGKKRWLRRKLNDELRIAAAGALGDMGEQSTLKVLEKVTHDRTAAVARAAAQAIKQLDKGKP
jgi:hypothetical protein